MIEVVVEGSETYTHTGLTPGYSYVWSVRVDFATSGSNQDFFEFTLSDKPLAPLPPANVEASDGQFVDEIPISWSRSYRTAYYLLQRRAPGDTAFIDLARVGEEETFIDKDGDAGERFQYRVLSCNQAGCGAPSMVDEGWKGVCQPVDSPTLVSPPDGTEIWIHRQSPWYTLEWEPVEGARSHILHVRDRDWERLVERVELEYDDAGSYEVTSIVGNLEWYVIATNPVEGCPDSAPSQIWEINARYYPPPVVPTNVEASDGEYPDQVVVTWEQPPSESTLEDWGIWRATSNNPDDAQRIGTAYEGPTYTDTEVTPGTLYYYWVSACSHADGCSDLSDSDSGYAGSPAVILEETIFVPLINQ